MIKKIEEPKKDTSKVDYTIEELFSDLMEIVKIDENKLIKEYSELPSHIAYWSLELVRNKHQLELARAELERYEASLYMKCRKEKSKEKLTESTIRSIILMDDKWQELNKQVTQIEYITLLLQSFVKALEKKADMLISLGATKRKEAEL